MDFRYTVIANDECELALDKCSSFVDVVVIAQDEDFVRTLAEGLDGGGLARIGLEFLKVASYLDGDLHKALEGQDGHILSMLHDGLLGLGATTDVHRQNNPTNNKLTSTQYKNLLRTHRTDTISVQKAGAYLLVTKPIKAMIFDQHMHMTHREGEAVALNEITIPKDAVVQLRQVIQPRHSEAGNLAQHVSSAITQEIICWYVDTHEDTHIVVIPLYAFAHLEVINISRIRAEEVLDPIEQPTPDYVEEIPF